MISTHHQTLTSSMIFTHHQILTSFMIFTHHQILTSSSNHGEGTWHTWRTDIIHNFVKEPERGHMNDVRVARTSNINMWF
jgi:hypothetical protein